MLYDSFPQQTAKVEARKIKIVMFKTFFSKKQKEECNCEKYFLDSFDKEHLYFVALGITTMENYTEMKRQYYENRIDKISQ